MRTKEQKKEILKLYHKAVEVIEDNPRWASGKTIHLAEGVINGHEVKFWLKNNMGHILLYLFEESKTGNLMDRKYWKYEFGWNVPVSGLKIVATEKTYLDWNFTTRKEFGLQI